MCSSDLFPSHDMRYWFVRFGLPSGGIGSTGENGYTLAYVNSILYVGGDFTFVNGNSWAKLAAFNTLTNIWFNPFGTLPKWQCFHSFTSW